ncbi:hypothetical protein [Cupriavidus pinatubonensis]|uniref:hypothetical protein n=1 Tax=Cupriavidus pinatubonensis TaxID=248026 RepID=UPI00361843BA
MGDGDGNVQIGTLVIHQCTHRAPLQSARRSTHGNDAMSLEERKDLTELVLDIEMAEDDLVDAATVWRALTRHLNGRGLADFDREETLTHTQHWSARTYLVSWLACRRGEPLPRTATMRQILRMWEICPGLKLSTQDLCRSRFRSVDLNVLSDLQLRAALWITLADWQTYWLGQQGT